MNAGIRAVIDGGSELWMKYAITPQADRTTPFRIAIRETLIPSTLNSSLMDNARSRY